MFKLPFCVNVALVVLNKNAEGIDVRGRVYGIDRFLGWVAGLMLLMSAQDTVVAQSHYIKTCRTQIEESKPKSAERLLAELKLTQAYLQYDLNAALEQSNVALDLAKQLDDEDAVTVCEMDQLLIHASLVGRDFKVSETTSPLPSIDPNAPAEYLVLYYGSAIQFNLLQRPFDSDIIPNLLSRSNAVKNVSDADLVIDELMKSLFVRVVLKGGRLSRPKINVAHEALNSITEQMDSADGRAMLALVKARRPQKQANNKTNERNESYRALLQEAFCEYQESGNRQGQIDVLGLQSDCSFLNKSWGECIELTQQRMALGAVHGSKLVELECYVRLARCNLKLDNFAEAKSLVQTALNYEYFKRQFTPVHDEVIRIAMDLAFDEQDLEKVREYAGFMSDRGKNRLDGSYDRLLSRIAKLNREKVNAVQEHEKTKQEMETQHLAQQLASRRTIQVLALVASVLLAAVLLIALYICMNRLGHTRHLLRKEQIHGRKGEQIRKGLERKLNRLERTESLGLLAGGIAHDFNNLLVGVLGNAEIAQMTCREDDGFLKERIDRIMVAAEKAADLSRQMLAYTGKKKTDWKTVDLNLLVENLAPVLKANGADSTDFEVSLCDTPLISEVDQTQIEQVILNLVSNAVVASERKRKKVIIRTGREAIVELDDDLYGKRTAGGDFNFIEIQDFGRGIAESKKEKIFDPFFSDNGVGRGLGLAVVYGMVTGHEGCIKLNSEVGKGTTFRILIPDSMPSISGETSLEQLPFAESIHHSNRPTVLVVDDQPQVLDFARHVLTHRGLNVIVADGGKQGFGLLEECHNTIGCILLDVVMPDFGAADFIDAMSQQDINVPIVLMSGYSNHRIAEFNNDDNVIGILEKPFPISELVGAISTALSTVKEETSDPSFGRSFGKMTTL